MHYLAILTVLLTVTLATGGHSELFSKAGQAIARGNVSDAVDLFSTALRRTLKDADVAQQRKSEGQPIKVADARPTRPASGIRDWTVIHTR